MKFFINSPSFRNISGNFFRYAKNQNFDSIFSGVDFRIGAGYAFWHMKSYEIYSHDF